MTNCESGAAALGMGRGGDAFGPFALGERAVADIGGSNGRPMQVRAIRKNGWTKAKRTVFLATLAAT